VGAEAADEVFFFARKPGLTEALATGAGLADATGGGDADAGLDFPPAGSGDLDLPETVLAGLPDLDLTTGTFFPRAAIAASFALPFFAAGLAVSTLVDFAF
jgi:hypothetical protein